VNLTLSQSQKDFLLSTLPVAAFLSGLGSGKTWIGTLWASITSITNKGSLGLIGANTPSQLHAVVVPSIKQHLDSMGVPYYLGEAPPWPSRFESHSNVLSIAGGTQILLRSMFESGIDRAVRGIEIDFCYLDEARDMEEVVLDVMLGRMRGKIGPRQIRITSTPNGKRGWLYKRMVSNPRTDWLVVRGSTYDNEANLPAGYIQNLVSTYGQQQLNQEVLGNWVEDQQGRAFVFDRNKHVTSSMDSTGVCYDVRKPLLFSMDLNVSPLCGVIAQHDPAKRTMHVFHEVIIRDNAQTRIACELVASRYADKFLEIWHMCDEAGAARSTRTLESDVQIMDGAMRKLFKRSRSLNGVAKPRVVDRYNSVNAMLDPAEGNPRLTFDQSCRELITDLEEVSWDDYGKIDKSDSKRTHMGDALGYLVHRLFPVGSEAQAFGLDGSLDKPVQQKAPQERGFPAPVGADR